MKGLSNKLNKIGITDTFYTLRANMRSYGSLQGQFVNLIKIKLIKGIGDSLTAKLLLLYIMCSKPQQVEFMTHVIISLEANKKENTKSTCI